MNLFFTNHKRFNVYKQNYLQAGTCEEAWCLASSLKTKEKMIVGSRTHYPNKKRHKSKQLMATCFFRTKQGKVFLMEDWCR